MDRITLACWALTASAFILAGMLLASWGASPESRAEARMVLSGDTLTVMTAQTRSNQDSLFVLDSSNGVLMIYPLDGRDMLEEPVVIELEEIFGEVPDR